MSETTTPSVAVHVTDNGDVYKVYRNTTTKSAAVGKLVRPMVCVAKRPPESETWKAMARSTTDGRPHEGDVDSSAQPDLGLDQDGHWSLRWLHDVLREKTGTPACEFKGKLMDPEKSSVLDLYRSRHQ